MNEKGPSVGQCPYLLRHFQRNSRCLTALLVLSNKFTGISRHAEGANYAGSQGHAFPVTELQSGRGAPKSIRRWKPLPETYPACGGVAQRLEWLTVNQRVVSGSSPLTGTNTTGKGILRRRRSPCLAEGSNPYEVPLPL